MSVNTIMFNSKTYGEALEQSEEIKAVRGLGYELRAETSAASGR